MVKLLGIYVLYRSPLPDKHYTKYAEIEGNFAPPIKIGCIFDEHPTQQTLKKLGWMSELNDSSSIIHVDYDLQGLQQGALFILPGGLDDSKGRLFRVVKLSNTMVYPASIACEIVPEYEDTFIDEKGHDVSHNDYTVISKEPETPQFLNDITDLGPKDLAEEDL